jgi:AcrR family transcriptional regulator
LRVTRNSATTRENLLEAAIAEFSAYGLAGGRVDRIALEAGANKRAIYDYYGDKQALFEAAVQHVAQALIAAVPLDATDLAGYAGALFDYLMRHPETSRLISWRRLERPDAAPRLAERFFGQIDAIGGAPSDGGLIGPVDLVILVIGLANAWDLTGADLVTADGSDYRDPDRIARHRRAVVEAARRLAGGS